MSGITGLPTNRTTPQPTAAPTGNSQGTARAKLNQTPQKAKVSTTNDAFKPNEVKNPEIKKTQITGHINEAKKKDQIIDGMLVKNESMTPENAQDIKNSLSKVNTDTLNFASKNGMQIQVVKPGDSLIDKGIVKKRSMKEVQDKAGEYGKVGSQVLNDVNGKYKDQLKEAREADKKKFEANQKNSPFGGGGFPAPQSGGENGKPPDIRSLAEKMIPEADKVDGKRRSEINEQLKEKTNDNVMLYDPTVGMKDTGGLGIMGMSLMHTAKMPVSTGQMAVNHGARTPEEIKQFNQTVEQLNGDRLKVAREESLQRMKDAKNNPGADKEWINNQLERYKEHPEEIIVDHNKHDILVPNRFHYRTGDNTYDYNAKDKTYSKPTTMNSHDYGTMKNWSDKDGKIMGYEDSMKQKSMTIAGQYFKDDKMFILRGEDQVLKQRDTAVHEFGHGVDFLLKEKNPEAHKNWRKDITAAYEGSKDKPDSWISNYSRTNENEYVAEGFTAYHTRKKVLKTLDPALHKAITQMDQMAQTEGRQVN